MNRYVLTYQLPGISQAKQESLIGRNLELFEAGAQLMLNANATNPGKRIKYLSLQIMPAPEPMIDQPGPMSA